ncbi:MAG: hypothetical protein ABJL43_16605 [Maribacter dokdonensis]|uniref:hypothetical protein n=1 Tax=Maribacter dokdonensis TaxID=320912 RepID=UPI00329921A1
MNTKLHRYGFVLFTLYAWVLIAWDYFHDGVSTHYLLHDENMPGISNWWGALIIPVLSYMTLSRIQKRQNEYPSESNRKIFIRFILSLVFASALSISFFYSPELIDYGMIAIFVISFGIPLYKSEYLLGFVIGAMFAFGAFIPTLAGLILIGIYFLFYTIGKKSLTLIFKK